ncbi:hypothetical protein ACIQK6_00735 [Streptomyces sp. NPDC091682]
MSGARDAGEASAASAGFDAVPVARAANACVKSVEGHRTGRAFLVE